MRLIKCTRTMCVLRESRKDYENRHAVTFDLAIIPLSPTPKRLDILPPRKDTPVMRMSWKKFGCERCLCGRDGESDIVLIQRDHFRIVA